MSSVSLEIDKNFLEFLAPQVETAVDVASMVSDCPSADEIAAGISDHFTDESKMFLTNDRPSDRKPFLILSPLIDNAEQYEKLLVKSGEIFDKNQLHKRFGRLSHFSDRRMTYANALDRAYDDRPHRLLVVSGCAIKFYLRDSERDLQGQMYPEQSEDELKTVPDNPGRYSGDIPTIDFIKLAADAVSLQAKRSLGIGMHPIDPVDYALIRNTCRTLGIELPDSNNTATLFSWTSVKANKDETAHNPHELPRMSQDKSSGKLQFTIAKNSFRDDYPGTFTRQTLIN